MIQPRSCSILSSYSLPDTQALERALREEVEKNRRKIVVLDDDPTGVQTVHDIYVYTDWTLAVCPASPASRACSRRSRSRARRSPSCST